MQKLALISDFDGTISKEDFFNMVIDNLLQKDDIQPWKDYLAGNITHVEALSRIFAKVRISQDELDTFIKSIKIDEEFPKALELCKNLSVPVYICSAGMDYYILRRIPDLIKQFNITVISNHATYSKDTGFVLKPLPETSPFYSKEIGVAKENVVKDLQKQGYFTIFVGDGRPDIKAAKIADAVFAKDVLLELCQKENIKTIKFDDFSDITSYIKNREKE